MLDDLWILSRGNGDRLECSSTCLFGNGINDDCATGNAVGRCIVGEREDVGEFLSHAAVDDAVEADRCAFIKIRHGDGIAESVHDGCLIALNGARE